MNAALALTLRQLAQPIPVFEGGRVIRTRAGQAIYTQGDPLNEIYVLTEGLVRLFVGDGARTALLLRAPALFGDRDVLSGCDFSQESAESVSRARLIAWPRADLEATLAADPALWRQVAEDLIQRYARTVRFADYTAQPIERRLLWMLRELRRSDTNELPPYEHLAIFADTTPKSVGRAMRDLEEAGLIRRTSNRAFELDTEALLDLGDAELLSLFHQFGMGG